MSCTFVEVDCPGEAVEIHTISDALVIEECKQGPPGPPGPQGPPGSGSQTITPVVIAPSNTATVDTCPISACLGRNWHIVAVDTVNGDAQRVTVYATWDSSGNTWRTVFGRGGSGFAAYDVLVTYSAPNAELRITNNHTNSISVHAVYLDIQ